MRHRPSNILSGIPFFIFVWRFPDFVLHADWFKFFLFAFFSGVLWLYYRRRLRKTLYEIGIRNKIKELESEASRAQMNPHFIFNSLASIQYYIQSGMSKEADNYLSKFAQLMRLFLESSSNKYIKLSEEINLLKLYVDLEKLRFEEHFEVVFDIDNDIDLEGAEIPSMLLQPFVENAINHGLFHKKGKGHLHIKFSAVDESEIVCVVEDDGIGRQAAATLPKQSLKNYKSQAMQIVQERIDSMLEAEGFAVTIKVEDLVDNHNVPCGTRVTLKIPVLD